MGRKPNKVKTLKVYLKLEEVPAIKRPVLTLGTFDGVHLGHQSILQHLKDTAKRIGGETVVFTFHPHPRIALNPTDHGLELIQSIDQRILKLEEAGIDHLILFPFTKEFSRLSALEFVRNILVNALHIHTLTIGYNHHFGRNREGNIELLQELAPVYGFNVEQIPAYIESDQSVSSTKIRQSISSGNIQEANRMLGSVFNFTGVVIEGQKLGRLLGFPTANIAPDKTQLTPERGVFAVRVKIQHKMYGGMMNIGYRPTVSESMQRTLEVHIFDFDGDLYGTNLELYFIDKIRDEKKFDGIESLKSQLKADEKTCRTLLDRSLTNVG